MSLEITVLKRLMLLILCFGFGFSGYLLPWNELAFFATKVGTDIVGQVPVVGHYFLRLLRGGDEVTGATLSRFFGFHVAVLPAIFTVILSLHLLFIQRQGMHAPKSWEEQPELERSYIPFFPNFLLKDLLIWLIVINVLSILAVFFPWELGNKADAFASAPKGIKPEWYFLFMFQVFKFLPAHILFLEGELVGIIVFTIAALLWFLVPLWDAKKKGGMNARLYNYIGIFVIVFIIIFTILGFILD